MTLDEMIRETESEQRYWLVHPDQDRDAAALCDSRLACLRAVKAELEAADRRIQIANHRIMQLDAMRESSSSVLGRILAILPPEDFDIDGTLIQFVDPDPQNTIRMLGRAIRAAADAGGAARLAGQVRRI